ncbi:MAG: DUF4412 domain-containing protein [Bacteroidetes bacterium]|nr:DUF4412 domain-containing protein [Bacteroidota bacterium]
MNKFVPLFALLLFASISFAEKGMLVTQKFTDANVKAIVTVTWYVTESACKMKMEFSDDKVKSVSWFIPDYSSNQLLTYAEGEVPAGAQKTYYAIPVAGIKSSNSATDFKIERTGETKTIGGINCEKIIAHAISSTTEMWVTKDFNAALYNAASFFANSIILNILKAQKITGVSLESITKDNGGKTLSAYSLISATSTSLTPADFAVPEAYKLAEVGKH